METLKVNLENTLASPLASGGNKSNMVVADMPQGETGQLRKGGKPGNPALPTIDIKELKEALAKLNLMIEFTPVRLEFSYNESANRMVVKVVDQESGKVLRQIPPEKVLETMQRIREFIGLLLDEKV